MEYSHTSGRGRGQQIPLTAEQCMLSATQGSEVNECLFSECFSIPSFFLYIFSTWVDVKNIKATTIRASQKSEGGERRGRREHSPLTQSCLSQESDHLASPSCFLLLPSTFYKEFCVNFPSQQIILEHNVGFKKSSLLMTLFGRHLKSLIPLPLSEMLNLPL